MLIIRSPAKVNLTLDVVGRRADGYHLIESVMQTIDLNDLVTLTPLLNADGHETRPGPRAGRVAPSPTRAASAARWLSSPRCDGRPMPSFGVVLNGNGVNADGVPTDETNLARRAVSALREAAIGIGLARAEDLPDLAIQIDKYIPVAAGLGGGSANAAAALTGANELWRLGLDKSQLAAVGVRLGADVPFCLLGGTAVARGIGERLTPVPFTPPMAGVVVTPSFPVATATVYKMYEEWNAGRPGVFRDEAAREEARRRTEAMLDALRRSDVYEVASLLHNALEPVTTRLHPEVGELRERLLRAGALGAIMCGSGPSVFGLARDEGHAADIAARMGRSGLFIAACSFIGSGSRIMEKGRRS